MPKAPVAHLATLLVPDETGGSRPGCSAGNRGLVDPLIKCLECAASEAADSFCAKLFALTFPGYLPPISMTWGFL